MNESEFRKPSFDLENTVPVVLADNQAWHFPRIWFVLRPAFSGGRATGTNLTSSIGTELDDLIKAVEAAAAKGDGSWPTETASLAAYMLSKTYDLTDEMLSELLVFPASGEHAYELLREILDVARGEHSPKGLTTSGSDVPS